MEREMITLPAEEWEEMKGRVAALERQVMAIRLRDTDFLTVTEACELLRVDLPELRGPWLVAKPQTFMNLSGQSVQPLLAWHKIPPNRLVVAHDELDIPAGHLRFKFGGGNAGHNGLKSITELLGTQNFYRLRIGIGRPRERFQVSDWVLTTMKEEAPLWEEAMDSGVDVLSAFAKKGLERAVTLANRASKRIAEEAAKESEEKKA